MKFLLIASLFGVALLADHAAEVEKVVSHLQRIDGCFLEVARTAGKYGIPFSGGTATPVDAQSRLGADCTDDDLDIIDSYLGCLASSTCEWASEVDRVLAAASPENPFGLVTAMPSPRECPKPKRRPSESCGAIFQRR